MFKWTAKKKSFFHPASCRTPPTFCINSESSVSMLKVWLFGCWNKRKINLTTLTELLVWLQPTWRFSLLSVKVWCVFVWAVGIFYDQFDIWVRPKHPLHDFQSVWSLALPWGGKNCYFVIHYSLLPQTSSAFVSPCSPAEAAAGDGDRPEDSGGWSEWCK